MHNATRYLIVFVFAVMASAPALGSEAEVDQVLDALHEQAAAANFQGYIALFHERAVFLGTDREEYWPLPEFSAYVKSRFDTGTGWTYQPIERHIHLEGGSAWFEERLHHARYGETRGTGVLLRTGEGWRIVQYNLALPIPNELFGGIASEIAEYYEAGYSGP